MEKSETPFNLLLNNLRSHVFDKYAILACLHFAQDKHRFNEHAKFTLFESITNTNKPKEVIKEHFKRREKFWIATLETLEPHGLNHELSPKWLYPAIGLFNFI